ncbi:MAG: Smr/MutS family protein [Muribaculaceae bacterium]|nr:Smr/MutS family protein [Muribaculaceae bacterium]
MKRLKEINLEEGKPTVADALIILKSSLSNAQSRNVGCPYIIHGYGSSGRGGAIREKTRQWLNAQARNGVVKCVINGEDFNLFNFKALELKNKYKELEQLLKVCNHGVTVV